MRRAIILINHRIAASVPTCLPHSHRLLIFLTIFQQLLMVNIVFIDIVVVVLIQGHLTTVFTDKLVLLRIILKAILIVHIFLIKNAIDDTLRITILHSLSQIFVLL